MAAESRLESRRDPLFEEPSRVVVFDLAFVKERFFDIQSGSLIEKVSSHDQQMHLIFQPSLHTGKCCLLHSPTLKVVDSCLIPDMSGVTKRMTSKIRAQEKIFYL